MAVVMILGGSQSELALSPDDHSKLSWRMVLEHTYHDKLTAIALVRDLLSRNKQMPGEDYALSSLSLETKELVVNCLSLGSVVRGGASATIPPLITQKLMERMFELLAPRFESNMELRSPRMWR